LYGSTDTVV